MAGHCQCFWKNFSDVVQPLTFILRCNTPFVSSLACQPVFESMKALFPVFLFLPLLNLLCHLKYMPTVLEQVQFYYRRMCSISTIMFFSHLGVYLVLQTTTLSVPELYGKLQPMPNVMVLDNAGFEYSNHP